MALSNPFYMVLKKHVESIELALASTNLLKLSEKLVESRIISEEVKDKFIILDQDHLDPDRRVRYLLQEVCMKVREDGRVYDRLVKVLCRLEQGMRHVCEAMRKDLDRHKRGWTGSEREGDVCLTEENISGILEIIKPGSYKWEEIGLALGLPKDVREECRKAPSNVLRLSGILEAWIAGVKIATMNTLKAALAGEIVALPNIALKLFTFQKSVDVLPETESAGLYDCLGIDHQSVDSVVAETKAFDIPDIYLQSYSTSVVEGKSMLLEVQVSCGGCEYQWSKDSRLLLDGADFCGVSSNFLYINEASISTEGKYSCCISNSSGTVYSDEIKLKVIFPPGKEHLIKLFSLIESEVPKDSWPPRGTSTFINLVLIRQSLTSKLDYNTVRGDVDDILESKEIVKYEEVFREYSEGALVLVEGRPGSGKTTLVNKLARDWATGQEVLLGAKLVFLITLRFLNFLGKDQNLLEILEVFYGSEVLRRRIEVSLQECGGKGVCFIIDGLDEYEHKEMQQSVINQLISKKYLPFSMVIVASRPVATVKLKKTCARRIEVLGFTKSQIKEYVESYPFSCSSDVSDMALRLIKYLDQHSNILHMCYLPVHAAMICFLFSELEDKMPHTETQIYEQFTIATLLRQKTRTEEHEQLKSLKDLCGKIKKDFEEICELAYNMTKKSQQVVSQSDSSLSLSDLSSSALGLLTVEQTFEIYGVENAYAFLHLSFQEYLAAYYVSELEEDKQKKMKEELLRGTTQNMKKFYCGILGAKQSILLGNRSFFEYFFRSYTILHLSFVQCAFESQRVELCEYLMEKFSVNIRGTYISPSDFVALGYVISAASKQVSELTLRDCTWDYDGAMAFPLMATRKRLHSIKCLNIHVRGNASLDLYKSINGILTHLPYLETLDLLNTELNKSGVQQLTSGIQLPRLSVLKFSLPIIPCSNPVEVLQLLRFGNSSLNQVYFTFSNSDTSLLDLDNHAMWRKWVQCAFGLRIFVDSDISWLHLYNSKFLCLNQQRILYCTEVVLVNCGIDDKKAEILSYALNTIMLENLVLDFNRVSDSGAVAIARCIAKCNVVQKVSIQCNSIGDSGAAALADAIVNCRSLRILDLQGNTLGDKGAMAVDKAAEGLLNLVVYLYNVNITNEVVKILEHRAVMRIKAMAFNSSWDGICDGDISALESALKCGRLPALKISKNNIFNIKKLKSEHVRNIGGLECYHFTDDTLPTLCGIINSMKNLQHLRIIVNFGFTNVQCLCDRLRMCRSLLSLSLHGIKLSCDLLEAIKCHTNLKLLSLSNSELGGQGEASLFNDHKSWVNLHTLYLRKCNIMFGIKLLAKVLLHCKNLRFLDLSDNYIGDSGCLYLAEGLQDHTSLLELKLGSIDITSSGVEALMKVISRNHLQHLDLSHSYGGIHSVHVLVEAICGDNLRILKLCRCCLNIYDALKLSAGFKSCRHLTELDISYNKIGSCGMSFLAKGLQHCTNLEVLNVSNNKIRTHGINAIVEVMKSCRYLRILDISSHIASYSHNIFRADDLVTLVVGWKHKKTLKLIISNFNGNLHMPNQHKKRCCSACDNLLKLFHSDDDYVLIECNTFK